MVNQSDLFYLWSLNEGIGGKKKMKWKDVVDRIYHQAEILHCEPIEKIADEYIDYVNIPEGDFDNVSQCRYTVPDHWTIGKVYQRLIEDTLTGDDLTTHVIRVYHSWVSDGISDYNTDFYYQPRGYISLCYKEDKLIAWFLGRLPKKAAALHFCLDKSIIKNYNKYVA